jgi:hypothetical protein
MGQTKKKNLPRAPLIILGMRKKEPYYFCKHPSKNFNDKDITYRQWMNAKATNKNYTKTAGSMHKNVYANEVK